MLSSTACRSSSLILPSSEGISVRASSAVSQQSVPVCSIVSATTLLLSFHSARPYRNPVAHSVQLTQLCPLKLGQLCQSLSLASDLLHRLAALEAREGREVGVVLVDQVVVGEREFGVLGARFLDTGEQLVGGGGTESGGRGHLAQLEVGGGFLVARGFGAAARSLREVCQAGHGCVDVSCERGMCLAARCDGDGSQVQHWGIMLERWYLRRCS